MRKGVLPFSVDVGEVYGGNTPDFRFMVTVNTVNVTDKHYRQINSQHVNNRHR